MFLAAATALFARNVVYSRILAIFTLRYIKLSHAWSTVYGTGLVEKDDVSYERSRGPVNPHIGRSAVTELGDTATTLP